MIREQNRMESNVMIRGFITLTILLIKEISGYDVPNNIADIVITLALGGYSYWSIRNSPRIKGEY